MTKHKSIFYFFYLCTKKRNIVSRCFTTYLIIDHTRKRNMTRGNKNEINLTSICARSISTCIELILVNKRF
jgi:hypothetical protein